MMHTSLSTYSGPQFLLFYAAAAVAAVIAGIVMPRFLRAEGRDRPVTDRLELAWLAGRSGRVTEAVLARLLGTGAVVAAGDNKLRVANAQSAADPGEQAILQLPDEFGITEAHRALKPTIATLETRLAEDGLTLTSGERLRLRLISILPYIAVLVLGAYRRDAGLAQGRPVGFLTIMIIVVAVLMIIRFAVIDRRTRAGQEAVAVAQDRSSRLKAAPTQHELGLGVALFGTAVLVGTPFSELHAMRQAAAMSSSGDFSSDSGGGGDGGGCGGGGCGGCGG